MNDVVSIASMAMFAFATSATPGPVNIISAMSGARFGALRSFPYVLGATSGFVAILLLVGAGLGLFITSYPLIAKLLTIVGAFYMLYLAYKVGVSSGETSTDSGMDAPPGFIAGVIAQVINPKAWIVSLSAISIYIATSDSYFIYLIILGTLFFIICSASLWAWTFIGSKLAKYIGSVRKFNILMSLLLVASIVVFLYEMLFPN